jgi:hypothetical protein
MEIYDEIHIGVSLGYCIRAKKPLLIGSLTSIAVVGFIVLPAIALSQLARRTISLRLRRTN